MAAPLLAADTIREVAEGSAAEEGESQGWAPSSLRRRLRWAAPCTARLLLLAVLGSLGLLAPSISASRDGDLLRTTQLQGALGKVRVEVYGMAGCPFTRAFVEGPLSEAMATVPELVDLRFHPFGNSYYTTEACGGTAAGMPFASYFRDYNATVRQCWERRCGKVVEEPAPGCYSGALVCQHGVTDCMVTTAWACAESMAGGRASGYMPFVWCTARRFLGVTSEASFKQTVQHCAATSGLDAPELLDCATGDDGRMLLNAQGRATPPHPGVPYVLVDGLELEDTQCVACGDGIIQKVCEAARRATGADTPVCKGIFGET